jgi:hypothetical protein
MLKDGSLGLDDMLNEISLGNLRPSLVLDIRYGHKVPEFLSGAFRVWKEAYDKGKGFVPHKVVYEAKRIRSRAIKEYERLLGTAQG